MSCRKLFFILAAVLLLNGMTVSSSLASDPVAEPIQVAQFAGEDFDDFDEYESAEPGALVADPFSAWNKTWFYFNDGLYRGVFKPLAQGYAWVLPEQPRQWVRNFFHNLLFPVRFINNVLTGKFEAAYVETSKFMLNSTLGVLGFGDVTEGRGYRWELTEITADGFGQTLGKAGIGHGAYLVWPIIGPSSIRESVGWVADTYSDPLTYANLTFIEFAAVRSYKNLNNLSLELKGNEYEALTEGAIDKYAAVRDAYIRYRAKKVAE